MRISVGDDATKVVNAVVSVALDGSGDVQVLAKGNDFYSAPRLKILKRTLFRYLLYALVSKET